VVDRYSTSGKSIIAGYHWFSDWGRDTMISLPGLTLSTGRAEVAREILKTFGQYLSQGMLPNTFPDSGMTPLYNTADATFWWAWALLKYFKATQDKEFVSTQLPLLDSVVTWHEKGTRYGLHVDPEDGLVTGGEAGVQLTWMDAKVGDYVVTSRQGKAVEINALWFNFLKILEYLYATVGGDNSKYTILANKVSSGFLAFWNPETSCLVDVLHQDGTRDTSVRPNQLIALSLPFDILPTDKARSVLAVVEQELLTPMGLRTLSPKDPVYKGRYGEWKPVASQYDRDITYHQGTVWPWLLGPWVDARIKIWGATKENFQYVAEHLQGIRRHIVGEAGLGYVSEIFDGDVPHHACGSIAQAWSSAELLRVLTDYGQLQSLM
ncbi:MAG: glycogen debranching protein, partial [Candidatus Melainabacteria bacterium]|nr:glycogen debranching protein [Candidatus Melainabacteria bacterium]